jgi:hypothetical protein
MLKDEEVIEVSNKVMGTVVYTIPERNNLVRTFRSKEKKKITMDELRAMSYNPASLNILRNYLTINNKEAAQELLGEVEPEYFYTTEDIKTLLASGTLEQFEDFLNFAPDGAIDQMKNLAVSTKLNDNRKRELIKERLEFDVTHAIELLEDKAETVVQENNTARKAAPINADAAVEDDKPARKSEPLKTYKVVN